MVNFHCPVCIKRFWARWTIYHIRLRGIEPPYDTGLQPVASSNALQAVKVRVRGLNPRLSRHRTECYHYTNSDTIASILRPLIGPTGFEPATCVISGHCSTVELRSCVHTGEGNRTPDLCAENAANLAIGFSTSAFGSGRSTHR